MKSLTENIFRALQFRVFMCHWSHGAHPWLWNVFSEVLWSEVKSMRWAWDSHFHSRLEWNTVSISRLHLTQLPVVWLYRSPYDCLPALTRAPASPPFLHETQCVLVCTRWSEPPPDSHWQDATSVLPGRCLFHTHLSPGSQRSADKWRQEVV